MNSELSREEVSPLRFGVLCRGTTLEAWQVDALDRLEALPRVQLALLIVDDRPPAARGIRRLRTSPLGELLFHLWCGVIDLPKAFRPVDLSKRLAGVPSIQCRVHRAQDGREHFSEADLLAIREYGLDFILQFGFGPLGGEILNAATHGIWEFSHGDPPTRPPGPPGFAEIYHGAPVMGAVLRQLGGDADGVAVLAQGVIETRSHSYAGAVDRLYLETTRWLPKACAELCSGNGRSRPPGSGGSPSRPRTPTNLQMVRFLLLTLRNACAAAYRELFRHEQWTVGVIDAPISALLDPHRGAGIRWLLVPRRGEFLADPFGVLRDGKLTILCEHFLRGRGSGNIASLEPTRGSVVRPLPVDIGPPVHRSYPFLFEHRGELFCVPETRAAREVGLYRAVEFPGRWAKVATLLHDIAAADSTVFEYAGLWWLACIDHDEGGPECLHLWYATDPIGPWVRHPGNPVKTDIRSSRPAGTPFVHQGTLFRPAQDCSSNYGKRVIINRVSCITPTAFAEEPAAVVEPDTGSPFRAGLHTISAVGDFTLVDGKRTVFSPSEFKRAAKRGVVTILPGLIPPLKKALHRERLRS